MKVKSYEFDFYYMNISIPASYNIKILRGRNLEGNSPRDKTFFKLCFIYVFITANSLQVIEGKLKHVRNCPQGNLRFFFHHQKRNLM